MKNINPTYINLVSVEAFKNVLESFESKLQDSDGAFTRGLREGLRIAYSDAMGRAETAGIHWDRDDIVEKYETHRKSLQSEKESYIEPTQSTSSKRVAVAQVEA